MLHDDDEARRAASLLDEVLTARERAERIRAQCARIMADADARAAQLERDYLPLLRSYAEQVIGERKRRSVDLPTGRLSLRRVPGGVRVEDAEALTAWARAARPELVEVHTTTTERVPASALKAYVDEVGEVPPGAVLVENRTELKIGVAKARGDDGDEG